MVDRGSGVARGVRGTGLHGRFWTGLAVAAVAALLAGCKGDDTRPDRPAVMADVAAAQSVLRYSLEEYKQDKAVYDEALQATRSAPDAAAAAAQYEAATVARDVMINRIRGDIRDHSGEFEDTLRQRIAEWSTGADFVELGLAAATTITGGEQAKSVLAAILTAIKGARISVDKNFFRERTSEAIVAALRSTRLTQDAAIVRKMSMLDVRKYTFEEAWNDLIDLYYAGTLASAFQTLAEEAGARADEARQEMAAVDAKRVEIAAATPDEIQLMGRLYGALRDMTDDQASAVLREIQVAVPAGTKPRSALQKELRRLPPGSERLNDIAKAYDKVLGPEKW